ncbi:MAG: hypothetical protein U0V54_13010 [Saprospiraceae bacterium]|nr:hypothetical protein [Saprospiraceae bacterium]
MNLIDIHDFILAKANFKSISQYIDFASNFLGYIEKNKQAIIISQNENNYCFFQYDSYGNYQITRPINTELFFTKDNFEEKKNRFIYLLKNIKFEKTNIHLDEIDRQIINNTVYTIQQSIGAALDSLQPGKSNTARKINGDLFENLIRIIFEELGIKCKSGVIKVPVIENSVQLFTMNYQHDLIVSEEEEYKIFGTIKTSSKDRLDKIFIDKFLYNKLSNTQVPHIAIILNDVQRKKAKKENEYGVSTTFLPGHFKGYTLKLNPLDGVYYCDLRSSMKSDEILRQNIRSLDHLLIDDIWKFL